MGPVLREYIVSEAMAALGVPTIGCSLTEVAQKTFAASHPGCPATVRARPDLDLDPGGSIFHAYEATGCGADVLYRCAPYHTEDDHGSGSTVLPACSATDWCTPDGCDSFELAARNTLVKDKSCPLERVTATPHAARAMATASWSGDRPQTVPAAMAAAGAPAVQVACQPAE